MRIADLDTTTVYAVRKAGTVYPAVVLFPARWRRVVTSRGGGLTELTGYVPDVSGMDGPNRGIPVLAAITPRGVQTFVSDDYLRVAADRIRPVMAHGERPEHLANILIVQPNAVLGPWSSHLDSLRVAREVRERAEAGQRAEQQAQDDARARVLAILGERRWGFGEPPRTWTEFEALAMDMAEAIGGALVDVMSDAKRGESVDELGAMAFAKIIMGKKP